MLVTREGLALRLHDGRWRQVSTGAAQWFIDSPRHEVQCKLFFGRPWIACKPSLIGIGANMRYRIRMLPQFLPSPFTREVQP